LGIPSGMREENGLFKELGKSSYLWSINSNNSSISYAWTRTLVNFIANVDKGSYFKIYGASVRCLRDY
jgi:hypothetical protein